ncbi:hypothetical protein BFN01_08345 [Microbacterium sp. AR7-10]|nr:hypothetical protein BFN01_08345 [Microbacterium sp. AR7-10]
MPLHGDEHATARTYAGAHRTLKRLRGSAVGKPCAAPGCRRLADGWGLIGHPTHIGPHPDHGRTVRWSIRIFTDYAPLCSSCNNLRDHGGSWDFCPRGHSRLAYGRSGGKCRGCRRDAERARTAAGRAAGPAAQAGASEVADGAVSAP